MANILKIVKTLYVNLILSCNHILYKVEYNSLVHQVGEQYWCPTCGIVGITELEGPYIDQGDK